MAVARRLVGRGRELQRLGRIFNSEEAEFLAIYGRPGVGKTYLIREYFRGQTYFEVTGEFAHSPAAHLKSFCDEVARVFYDGRPIPPAKDWYAAFELLCAGAREYALRRPGRPIVIFLDEISWLAGPRSTLPAALARAWTSTLARIETVRLIVCGSAVAWMLDRFVFAKDSLPKSVTHKLELRPFSLNEASEFLNAHAVDLSQVETAHLYMSIGGVPQYLRQVRPGRSVTEIIGELFFGSDGLISTDLSAVLAGLFESPDLHLKVLRALALRRHGQSQDEVAERLSVPSGVRLKKCLGELEASGLVASFSPYSGKKRDAVYRVADEYTYFYFRWIDRVPEALRADGVEYWQAKAGSEAYERWAYYAFESLCLKHMNRLAKVLGVSEHGIDARMWRHTRARWAQPAAAAGAQIPLSLDSEEDLEQDSDGAAQVALLLDGDDDATTICELKYSEGPFSIEADYARYLAEKLRLFGRASRSTKTLKLVMVSPEGLEETTYSGSLVGNAIALDALFDPPVPRSERAAESQLPAPAPELPPLYGPDLPPLPDVVPQPIVLQELDPLPDYDPASRDEPEFEPVFEPDAGQPLAAPDAEADAELAGFEPVFDDADTELPELEPVFDADSELEEFEPVFETDPGAEPGALEPVFEGESSSELAELEPVFEAGPGLDLRPKPEATLGVEPEALADDDEDDSGEGGGDGQSDDPGEQDMGDGAPLGLPVDGADSKQGAAGDVGGGDGDSESGGPDDEGRSD